MEKVTLLPVEIKSNLRMRIQRLIMTLSHAYSFDKKTHEVACYKPCYWRYVAAQLARRNDRSGRTLPTQKMKDTIITKRSYSWIGMIKIEGVEYLAFSEHCPLDYCNQVVEIDVMDDAIYQDRQCHYNRRG